MKLRAWKDLPKEMKNDAVKPYYMHLYKKRMSLCVKRIFDICASIFGLILLSPVFLVISVKIKLDSKGPILFKQIRVTQFGKEFKIYKFRTMVEDAEKLGSQVTTKGDMRVTRVGKTLRKYRLDEIPQLINILKGEMTFVGTRPEVPKYVEKYTDEMYATLLLPAGVTSMTSIEFKDEEKLMEDEENADETYVEKVLPEKMKWNLKAIREFSFWNEIETMIKTVIAVVR